MKLYFAGAEDGGHGYTLGRVPINSCDFSPASYSFDDTAGDTEMKDFDKNVQHDVDSGMIPMIKEAQALIEKRGEKLTLYGSPWSPPAWMKLPVMGKQNMTLSATPTCLMPSMQRAWAKYFSKFMDAYKSHGIDMWGVTVQNEPEAAVGWEACLWTPAFMASFVRDHLGPVLAEEQPGAKIIGFDHNKDHVAIWAKELYKDPEAAKYFAGVGVHWYGGLNTKNLQMTHDMAPDKIILGTEACNCGGVVYKSASFVEGEIVKGDFLPAWWGRAEALALDILEDLRFWAVGWTDWNLVLSTSGGPNHLKNLCDANIIADPTEELGMGTLILQASFYYMGHFSRYLPAGSKRVALKNSVEFKAPPLEPGDVKNGQALLFAPCDGNDVQKWTLDDSGSLIVTGSDEASGSEGYTKGGECVVRVFPETPWLPGKIQTYACEAAVGGLENQQWAMRSVDGGSQLYNPPSGLCLTAVSTDGGQVGLDKGLTVVAAKLLECLPDGDASQTFVTSNYDGQGFPDAFPVRTSGGAPGGGGLCLQPQIVRLPHFDAVAFEQPSGDVTVIVMNIGDRDIEFSLVDKQEQAGVRHLSIPSHGIHTYRYKPEGGGVETLATTSLSTAAALGLSRGAAAEAAQQQLVAVEEGEQCGVTVDQRRDRGTPFALNAATAATSTKQGASSASSSAGHYALWGVGVCVVAGVALLATTRRAQLVSLVTGRRHASSEWEPCEVANDYHEYGARSAAEEAAGSTYKAPVDSGC